MPTTLRPFEPHSAWHAVPPALVRHFAATALAEVPDLAEEILREIRNGYPHLRFSLDESGEPMALVGIRHALEGFVRHLLAEEGSPAREHHEVFQKFGRAEVRDGRSLDSLQAVYRLGVRLSWRRLAEIGQRVRIPPPAMYELADAGYEYLDGLVEESVRGYAEAAARRAGERLRLQQRLMDLVLSDHRDAPATDLAERASQVAWTLPKTVSVGLLLRPARESVAPAVGTEILLDMESERPRIVIPDPETGGRTEQLRSTLVGWAGAIGPPVPLASAAKSLRWAEAALGLMERGLLPRDQVLHCSEHIESLVLLQSEELIDDLARRCLAPLEHCAPTHGKRLAETLLAWLETRGGAPEIATRLGVHPQTVRYRLRQIRDLWGEEIDDPDGRFAIELVLRAQRLRERTEAPVSKSR
ncbi:helix-turn-helix domain-containing protein [Streptomyces sp. NA04227]|uniref:PucR family transcriptional regulator n=1 Tax=Streptomyces sp. NA04227 TaxID=2742136 RepID=UPI0015928D92|nr:PucR family transcriptional regulator [Streptomyces sp. NA04227]QKW10584.1 helix-turn-helix domain-containing protein [Streptomyces sp. NA04227]